MGLCLNCLEYLKREQQIQAPDLYPSPQNKQSEPITKTTDKPDQVFLIDSN